MSTLVFPYIAYRVRCKQGGVTQGTGFAFAVILKKVCRKFRRIFLRLFWRIFVDISEKIYRNFEANVWKFNEILEKICWNFWENSEKFWRSLGKFWRNFPNVSAEISRNFGDNSWKCWKKLLKFFATLTDFLPGEVGTSVQYVVPDSPPRHGFRPSVFPTKF